MNLGVYYINYIYAILRYAIYMYIYYICNIIVHLITQDTLERLVMQRQFLPRLLSKFGQNDRDPFPSGAGAGRQTVLSLLVTVLSCVLGVKAGAVFTTYVSSKQAKPLHPCPWQACRGPSYIKCNNIKTLKVSWPFLD